MFNMKIFLLAVLVVALFAAETFACIAVGSTCGVSDTCCNGQCIPGPMMGLVGTCI